MFEHQRAQQLKALASSPQWQALLAFATEYQDRVKRGRLPITPGATTAEQVGVDAIHRDGKSEGVKELLQGVMHEIETLQNQP